MKTKKKYTLKKCKKEMVELWETIVEEEVQTKSKPYRLLGWKHEKHANMCPCCQYVVENFLDGKQYNLTAYICKEHCPIQWYDRRKGAPLESCEEHGTPYDRWTGEDLKDSEKAAKEILRLAKEIVIPKKKSK